ncbi:MAG: GTPase [Synechococcales cyanobacterium CRU_2_2]|nr:GTPase [Synechococcales cyanobacterium CRU_2_2]
MGIRLAVWQWIVLAAPIATITAFVMISAGAQIHAWGISWIWAVFALVLLGWRWLLVRWTGSRFDRLESAIEAATAELEASGEENAAAIDHDTRRAEAIVQRLLRETQEDSAVWEDWGTFWQRCLSLVTEIAHVYYPEVKYPLLNIYVPQAYALMRGTTDDLDQWMQKLAPALNQMTVGQVYQGYEVYRKLEPSARKLLKAWQWVQWAVNPVVAVARTATQGYSAKANQQLLLNLNQLLREAALRNLAQQAIALYSGNALPAEAFAASGSTLSQATLPQSQTDTLRSILDRAEPVEAIAQKPVNILLVGRTGAGKSSLINTLFQAKRAEVDVLPSTDNIQSYTWQTPTGETLNLWDTPGYEQVERGDLRELVLNYAAAADLILLVTPALDPSLQMDVDFLGDLPELGIPAIAVLTQVDRLRPLREWEPPYDWLVGDRPKETSIRAATQYRAQALGDRCAQVIPVVTGDLPDHSPSGLTHDLDQKRTTERVAWNMDVLSLALLDAIDPAKQVRLARFLRNQDARTVAAAKIIDHYTFQMATTQGLAALLKSPVLQFISVMSTGSTALAQMLMQQIPVERLPVVIGRLQMAYDLFTLLKPDASPFSFDLPKLWPLLLHDSASTDDRSRTITRDAWAFGHGLVEFWIEDLSTEQLRQRFEHYLADGLDRQD